MKISTVGPTLAKNPYKPGVGTRPPFLAGRDEQLRRFARLVEDYPEKRNNLRITGLRGVGKTVLRRAQWLGLSWVPP